MTLLFEYYGMNILSSAINDMLVGSLFFYLLLFFKPYSEKHQCNRGQITGVQSKKLLSLFASGSNRWSQVCRELRQAEINGVAQGEGTEWHLGDQELFLCFHQSSCAALGKLLQPVLAQVVTKHPCVCPHSVASYHEAYGLICRSAKHSLL